LLRIFYTALAILFCGQIVFGDTFVFKNGKKVDGKILVEDTSTFRILEKSGLNMTLKKDALDLVAMRQINRKIEEAAAIVASPPPVPKPSKKVRSFTYAGTPSTKPTKRVSVQQAERDLARLSAACRAAGGSSSKTVLRTDVYYVNGKKVSVTGYWAHPSSIQGAKEICQQAIEAQATLEETKREQAGSSSISSAGGMR
jgi:hypothetical protein